MRFISIKKIVKLFEYSPVCVTGMKGRGKDMLTSNVVARRKLPYVSNVNYGGDYHKFVYDDFNLSGNTYRNLLSGKIKYYEYPFPPDTDLYLSDCGIYFPSQYCNELNKLFPALPMTMAISRHLNFRVHVNVQNLNRVYDKIREMSDIFLTANWIRVLFKGKLVVQKITIYDKYQSCVDRVKPNRIKIRLWDSMDRRLQKQIYIDKFFNQYGSVKSYILVYRNLSNYDTHHFREVFKNGEKS